MRPAAERSHPRSPPLSYGLLAGDEAGLRRAASSCCAAPCSPRGGGGWGRPVLEGRSAAGGCPSGLLGGRGFPLRAARRWAVRHGDQVTSPGTERTPWIAPPWLHALRLPAAAIRRGAAESTQIDPRGCVLRRGPATPCPLRTAGVHIHAGDVPSELRGSYLGAWRSDNRAAPAQHCED